MGLGLGLWLVRVIRHLCYVPFLDMVEFDGTEGGASVGYGSEVRVNILTLTLTLALTLIRTSSQLHP